MRCVGFYVDTRGVYDSIPYASGLLTTEFNRPSRIIGLYKSSVKFLSLQNFLIFSALLLFFCAYAFVIEKTNFNYMMIQACIVCECRTALTESLLLGLDDKLAEAATSGS